VAGAGCRCAVAAGWDGDRFAAHEGPGGALCILWLSAWDSEADAEEFRAALERILAKRGIAGATALERRGERVLFLDGGPVDLLPRLRKEAWTARVTRNPRER
jgi:hypothetical protein